jgi:hypothetical protein
MNTTQSESTIIDADHDYPSNLAAAAFAAEWTRVTGQSVNADHTGGNIWSVRLPETIKDGWIGIVNVDELPDVFVGIEDVETGDSDDAPGLTDGEFPQAQTIPDAVLAVAAVFGVDVSA